MADRTLHPLDIFISSPSDVSEERKLALKVIEQLNELPHIQEKYVLKPLAWERNAPAAVGETPQRIVDRYMLEAAKADILICIMWARMGTPTLDQETGEEFDSGTEYEFTAAYRANQKTMTANYPGRPQILLYRCNRPIPPDDVDPEQLKKVQDFFERFKGLEAQFKGLYREYSSLDEFKELLSRHLETFIHQNFQKATLTEVPVPGEQQGSRHDFYQHVPLPPNYVPRGDLLTEVRAGLLSGSRDVALTSALLSRPAALHGMGGIGKSVMARALCDDPIVQAAFPDGILWATLGKDATDADVIQQMRDWVIALGGKVIENAPSINTLKNTLAGFLKDQACLLIVDDVWQHRRADHFRLGGPRCRLVITTRDGEVARELGARVQPIPLMTEDEAVALLETWADGALLTKDRSLKGEIVRRLGRLPLAVKLAGGQHLLRRDPTEWLRILDVRELHSSRLEDVHDSLEQTFSLSLEGLGGNRDLYAGLVIFREDEAIPEIALARLWEGLRNLDRNQTAELIDDLASRALLELRGDDPKAVVLHDLLRDLMRVELGGRDGQAHEALLQAYTKTKTGEGWNTIPDDGYIYGHLTYHLREAGRVGELYTLLTGSPDWMEKKFVALGGHTSYVADLDLALETLGGPLTPEKVLLLAQLETARQVVHQWVRMYTDVDLRTLVLLGRDSEALSHASLRSDVVEKFRGLLVVGEAQRERGRSGERSLQKAQEATQGIKDASRRAEVLRAVASALAQAGREEEAKRSFIEAQEAAQGIKDAYRRAEALQAAAVALAQAGHSHEAREAAQAIENASRRAEVLRAGALALAHAGRIEDAYSYAEVLRAVASALAQAGREEEAKRSFIEAQEAAQAIENRYSSAYALQAVAVAWAQVGHSHEAREAAQGVQNVYRRAEALQAVEPWLWPRLDTPMRPGKLPRLLRMHPGVLRCCGM
jgi:hypothetical protein